MTHPELANEVLRASHLTGTFRLRSGATSNEYFDKYRFESNPALLRDICTAMVPLVSSEVEVLAGLELGGIPIATVLGQLTGLPVAFVRKKAKAYGTCQMAEGCNVSGRTILVVEDVVTSGGQVVESSLALRQLGARVEHALCVIERDGAGRASLEAANVRLTALFTQSQLTGALG
jgi:orotate phosphoribosyltransferase